MIKRLLLGGMLICCALNSKAQKEYYINYQAFDEKDGYKVNEPCVITQDKRGLLWIGSDNGLFSFDGTHFKNYRHRANDSGSLPLNNVMFNYQDREGLYWVAVVNHGLYRFDPKTAAFTPFQYSNQHEFNINEQRINPPTETNSGVLWFPLPNFGLAKWDRRHNKMIPYKICPPSTCKDYISDSWINYLMEDPDDGTLWGSSNDGLVHFFPSNGAFVVYRDQVNAGTKPGDIYNYLLFDKKGQLWVGTWGRGIKSFNRTTGQFNQYCWSAVTSGTVNICSGIVQLDETHLWVGTGDRELLVFNTATHQFSSVRKSNNLPRREVLFIPYMVQNKKGVIWGTNKNRLIRINPSENHFTYYSLEEMLKQGMLKQKRMAFSVHSFIRQKQLLYIGIAYDGFFAAYNMDTQRFKIYGTLQSSSIMCLSEDSDKKIWIGSVKGTYIFDPVTQRFSRPATSASTACFFQRVAYSIVHARDGSKWLATPKGLVHYDPVLKTTECFTTNSPGAHRLQQDVIFTTFEDSKGNIWFGNRTSGLACYQPSTGQIIYFNPSRNKSYPQGNCESITEAKDGSILFTISKTGLYILRNPLTHKESIQGLNSSNILPTDNIYGIFRDKRYNIWLTTPFGLCWFDPVSFQTRIFTDEDGLTETVISSNLYQDDQERIYVGFGQGFQVFGPQQLLQPKTDTDAIHIASLQVNGKEWPVSPDYIASLDLDHTQTHITFDFSILSTVQRKGFRYAYKLDGLEKEWNYTGAKASGQYNILPPGKYVLHIKAGARDGSWSKREFVLPLTIHPPWFRSWWFYSLLVLVMAALIYAVYRYRINQLLKLQQVRTQIASDLHDDIGSTLTSISFYSEAVKMQLREEDAVIKSMLDKIANNARNMLSSMNDIVWVINPGNDKAEDLLTRMKRHTAELVGERNIPYQFEVEEGRQDLKLNLQQRKNIYLIYKEALHNAVKYAGCSKITINFLLTGEKIILQISDNGKGFRMDPASTGNGLANMKRRAEEINGSFDLQTAPGEGTVVRLSLKIS